MIVAPDVSVVITSLNGASKNPRPNLNLVSLTLAAETVMLNTTAESIVGRRCFIGLMSAYRA